MKHYELEYRDEKGYVIGGWGKVESIDDISNALFHIINDSYTLIKVNYLRYYNFQIANFNSKYFDEWLESIKNDTFSIVFEVVSHKSIGTIEKITACLVEVDR